MRAIVSWSLAALIVGCFSLPAFAGSKKPTAAQMQAQIKKLTQERDELKERLAATEDVQQDLAAAQKGRDLARQETEGLRKQLSELKASLAENQSGGEAILKDLQKAKADLTACQAEKDGLKNDIEEMKAKAKGPSGGGALVPITPEITPARALNLNRVTPTVKKVDRGVVVVNVLVSEEGEVLDTRLLQGLPGEGEWVQKANDACVDAAKRLVFDPARAADGKTKVRVWQGVGFYLN